MPPTARATACTARTAELTKHQSISCQVSKDGCSEEFKTFLSGLCEWVYYEEDETADDDEEEENDEDEIEGGDLST